MQSGFHPQHQLIVLCDFVKRSIIWCLWTLLLRQCEVTHCHKDGETLFLVHSVCVDSLSSGGTSRQWECLEIFWKSLLSFSMLLFGTCGMHKLCLYCTNIIFRWGEILKMTVYAGRSVITVRGCIEKVYPSGEDRIVEIRWLSQNKTDFRLN